MDFEIPADIAAYLRELDAFIEREIRPLERENDNIRFFDHRREHARTDWENDGQPRHEWEALLAEMRRRADKAGHLRFGLPRELGGKDGSNLAMAIIREHLAHKGLGLHNDLQNESSIVGNFPVALLLHRFGTKEQKERYLEGDALLAGEHALEIALLLLLGTEAVQQQRHREVADDRALVLQVVVQAKTLVRQMLADDRHGEVGAVLAAEFLRQAEAQVAGLVGAALHLG